MKYLLTILLILICFVSLGQSQGNDSTKYIKSLNQYGIWHNRVNGVRVVDIPHDTLYSKSGIAKIGTKFFIGNDIRWTEISGTGGGGCDTCVVRDFAFDTLTVKSILQNGDTIPAFVLILDSSWYRYGILNWVKYGDTASMLDPYKFHEIITYQKTLINQGVTPLSQYNQIDAGGFEQDRRNSPLWYDEAMNVTDSSKAIMALNASNADSPLVRLQAQNIAGSVTSKIEINKHWPQVTKNGGTGKNIVTSINGTNVADTSGNVNVSTGLTYTATHGVVIQGSNIKLQDTLNGAGTKFMWLFNKHAFRVGSVTGGSATNWDYDSIGTGSVAMGDNSKATGLGGVAIGRGATAAGQSVALGTFSHALGGNSVALATASSNSANGTNSISIGANVASGTNSISMNGDADVERSVAIGFGTRARHYSGTVLGQFNDTASAASPTSFNLLNRVFQVGVGDGTAGVDHYGNGLTLLFNGQFTLNKYITGAFYRNDSTTYKPVIIDATGNVFRGSWQTAWGLTGNVGVNSPDTSSVWIGTTNNTPFRFKTNGTGRMIIDSAGNVGIGNTSPTSILHTTSFATAYRAITALRTLDITDNTIECTSGTFTVTLPTSVGIIGREYWITNTGSGTITIGTTSSQTFINVTGTPTTLTVAQFTNYKVVANGTNWLAYKIVN